MRSPRGWLAVVVLVAGCRARGDQAFRPLAVGEPAPRYAVRTLAGDSARVGVAGQPLTLVNVWATWCIPCREEFADLERLHGDYRARGLRVLAVSIDQGGDADVRTFVAEKYATFLIGRDADGDIQRVFQTVGVPETFLIAGDGKLLWRKIGALRNGAPDARQAIDAALAAH